jgi:hypothetical protein
MDSVLLYRIDMPSLHFLLVIRNDRKLHAEV